MAAVSVKRSISQGRKGIHINQLVSEAHCCDGRLSGLIIHYTLVNFSQPPKSNIFKFPQDHDKEKALNIHSQHHSQSCLGHRVFRYVKISPYRGSNQGTLNLFALLFYRTGLGYLKQFQDILRKVFNFICIAQSVS